MDEERGDKTQETKNRMSRQESKDGMEETGDKTGGGNRR